MRNLQAGTELTVGANIIQLRENTQKLVGFNASMQKREDLKICPHCKFILSILARHARHIRQETGIAPCLLTGLSEP